MAPLSRPDTVMSGAPVGAGAVWHDLSARVPRKDQVVRVLTRRGTDHVARFLVHHTDDWPSGVAWAVGHKAEWVPFETVTAWSPDPGAASPVPPSADRPPSDSGDAQREEATPAPDEAARPAILTEIAEELEHTRATLTLMPPDHMTWSPHPSLPTLGVLAQRLVRIVARIGWILEFDAVEIAFEPTSDDLARVGDLTAAFDANADEVTALLDRVDSAALRAAWRLEAAGDPVATMARGTALRRLGLTPLVYHRGEAALLMRALALHPPHPYPVWAFRDATEAVWDDGAGP